MSYTHLTREERYQIFALRRAGHSQAAVAAILGRDPATISRELRRNLGQRGYRAAQADRMARRRARASRRRHRISFKQWRAVATLLRQEWSPKQIADRAEYEETLAISHECIYQFIYADKASGGDLWRYLRCQRPHRKRYGSGRQRRGQIRGRIGIEHRPAAVEKRDRIGHWEADTVHGRRRQGGVLTLVERYSRLTRLAKLARINSATVRAGAKRCLGPIVDRVETVTADNGREFAAHRQLAVDLDADFYFADPYCSWQRGTNENTNGLIRQYLPKKRDLRNLTGSEIRKIENRLNYRPRECLGALTPHEVFYNTRLQLTVALRG